MRPVKVASELLYETSAVSLFTRLPTPTILAARGSHITLTVLVTLARSFVLRSSPRFSRKRETARSLFYPKHPNSILKMTIKYM